MSKIKMKARAGVTLVELLVVMLIAVILAVGLLPMFKEYICKAQYNAEAVPVIATLRTKISLYQYDHGKLPSNPGNAVDQVSSWEFDENDKQKFVLAQYKFGEEPSGVNKLSDGTIDKCGKEPLSKFNDKNAVELLSSAQQPYHLGWTSVLDIDYQDLKGKRSLPIDYFYFNIPCKESTDSAYIVGCFGSGNGLAAGTGYAVCEVNLVSQGKKYIGTFERYKAKEKGDGQCPYLYLSDDTTVNGNTVYCPKDFGITTTIDADDSNNHLPNIIVTMQEAGWKFTD